jgi:hypothetical protein
LVQHANILGFADRNADKTENTASQVHERMNFDCGLVLTEMSPDEERKKKVSLCGIESVGGLIQGNAKALLGVHLPISPNEDLGKTRIDVSVSVIVGFGQSTPCDGVTEACMVKLYL